VFRPEQGLNLISPQSVKVVGHRDLTRHEPEPVGGLRGRDRGDLNERLAGFRDHEGMASGRLIDEPREVGLERILANCSDALANQTG
jgi:hypothetical protein